MLGYWVIVFIIGYFAMLMAVSYFTDGNGNNDSFYRGNKRSPWWLVAIGMVGTSISGVTFVSVPGLVQNENMSYMQMVLGFAVGYVIIANVLLPLYYKLNLISIYKYLDDRFGIKSYKVGALFFIVSKITGAAARLYIVVYILQYIVFDKMGIPFIATTSVIVFLIWMYSHRNGIKTIVRTDALQTVIFVIAVTIILIKVMSDLNIGFVDGVKLIASNEHSRIFVFDDWNSTQNFFKQFFSGIFITIVMTGLDQDMMQKNLTINTVKNAKKNMYWYGLAFIPVNILFLSLGVLLVCYADRFGIVLPANGDEMLPKFAVNYLGNWVLILFCVGIVSAAFSSADSALTSLTTSFCIDILNSNNLNGKKDIITRKVVHVSMCAVFIGVIALISVLNNHSIIEAIYIMAGYTYGPLLGLFAYGLFTKGKPLDRLVPYMAVTAPILSYLTSAIVQSSVGYVMGYELLILNGALTFLMLTISSAYNNRSALTIK